MKNASKTKYLILGTLSIGSFSGYEIRKFIKDSLSHFWAESNGQIYPALSQMLKDGWIKQCEKNSSEKKQRHLYTITPKGVRELENWLEFTSDGGEKDIQRDEGLLKLFFGSNASILQSIHRLKKREQKTLQKLQEYLQIKEEIEKLKDSPHFLFWESTLENGITHAKAELEWCKQSMKKLEKAKK